MDSFSEPHRRIEHSLDDVRSQVHKLEEEHRAKGIPLSGRIIHVTHYLPVTCALSSKPVNGHGEGQPGIPSPPQTPPAKASDIPPSPTEAAPPALEEKSRWQLNLRYGHSAMVSGIASLAATHEQIFVGWTGDFYQPSSSSQSESATTKLSASSISQEDKTELESILASGKHLLKEELPEGKTMNYVPVWLEDKQAHGHYDGYCKQSEPSFLTQFLPLAFRSSSLPDIRTSMICHFHPYRLNLPKDLGLSLPSAAWHSSLPLNLPLSFPASFYLAQFCIFLFSLDDEHLDSTPLILQFHTSFALGLLPRIYLTMTMMKGDASRALLFPWISPNVHYFGGICTSFLMTAVNSPPTTQLASASSRR